MKTTELRFYAKYVLIGLILGLVIGFFGGRSSIDTKTKTEYIKGETVTGSISPTQFEPIKEEKPDIQLTVFLSYQSSFISRYVLQHIFP